MNKRRKTMSTNGAAPNRAKAFEPDHADSRGAIQSPSYFVPRTKLGRRLLQIRRKILASGQPLLNWNEIECELRERRGEANEGGRD
jgi:hypothetical protein